MEQALFWYGTWRDQGVKIHCELFNLKVFLFRLVGARFEKNMCVRSALCNPKKITVFLFLGILFFEAVYGLLGFWGYAVEVVVGWMVFDLCCG